MRRTLIAATAAAALALGAPAALAGPPETEDTIVDIASSIRDGEYGGADFDILVDLVVAYDLADVLDGKRQFTVFAPTDDAFLDLFAFAEANDIELTPELVADVLLYHVAPGERFSGDVATSSQVNTLLKGNKIPIGTGDTLIGNANPVLLDVDASNGVIHVIDAVLLPGMDS